MGAECPCERFHRKQDCLEIVSTSSEKRMKQEDACELLELSTDYSKINSGNNMVVRSKTELNIKKSHKRVQLMIPEPTPTNNFIDNIIFQEQKKKLSVEDRKIILSSLNKHFVLSQLAEIQKQALLEEMKYCFAKAQTYIFKKGDPSFSFYIIISGQCQIEIDGVQKKLIGPHKSFGDLGLVYNAPRSASIHVKQDCLLVELNRISFRVALDKLNEIMEKQNKTNLQKISIFNQLQEQQKNLLASNSFIEIYEPEQIIFRKGDDANAFYIVRKGTVTIQEKSIDLSEGEDFGLNALSNQKDSVRSSTLVAKTQCELLSLTKQVVAKYLGDNITTIIKNNMVKKLIKESCLKQSYDEKSVSSMLLKAKFQKIYKGEILFETDTKIPKKHLYVILGTELINQDGDKIYDGDSLIEPQKILKESNIIFNGNLYAKYNGYYILLKLSPPRMKKKVSIQDGYNDKNTKLSLDDFIALRKLQSGNFGQVYACYNKKTFKKYAIKVMDKNYLNKQNIFMYVINQQKILQSLHPHPFIVNYCTTYSDKIFIQIVFELIEGQDFFDRVSQERFFAQKQVKFYIAQILLGIEYLHHQQIVYRDLKPQNLVIGQDGYLKMVDMGISKKLTMSERYKTKTIVGTPYYMAPQILIGRGYSFSVDVWSMGVLMFEILYGELPFGQDLTDPFLIYREIIAKQINLPKNGRQENAKDIICRMLKKSPQQREKNSIQQLKKHPFFSQIDWSELMNKKTLGFYIPDPSKRITQTEINKCIQQRRNAVVIFLSDRRGRNVD